MYAVQKVLISLLWRKLLPLKQMFEIYLSIYNALRHFLRHSQQYFSDVVTFSSIEHVLSNTDEVSCSMTMIFLDCTLRSLSNTSDTLPIQLTHNR